MQQEILQILEQKTGREVSGEAIALRLKISRTAVWKGVRTLRREGYRIESVRTKGYRLVSPPERLSIRAIEAGLKEKSWVRKIDLFEKTTSTNDEAIRRAKEGGAEGEVFLAEQQTAGRGRMGRSWVSPPRKNLYLSVLLRPAARPGEVLAITLMAAQAVHEALQPFAAGRLTIKWPNDIYLDGRKVAGILTEMESEADRVHWVVVGIGVNVNSEEGDFPAELRTTATSLRSADRNAVAVAILDSLTRAYRTFTKEGPSPAIAACERESYLKNRSLEIAVGDEIIKGRYGGLDPAGFLTLIRSDGGRQTIYSGDIHVVGA